MSGWGSAAEKQYDGWTTEDKDLRRRFRDDGRYGVLRPYEPGLFHVWHPKKCVRGSKEYKICVDSARWKAGGCLRVEWQGGKELKVG